MDPYIIYMLSPPIIIKPLYVLNKHFWTNDPEEAMKFSSNSEAMSFIKKLFITDDCSRQNMNVTTLSVAVIENVMEI